VDQDRQHVHAALAIAPDRRSLTERHLIRSLAESVYRLAQIQRLQQKAVCADTYREALNFADEAGDTVGQAFIASGLGNAFLSVDSLHDLDEAERWFQKSLEVGDAENALVRGRTLGQLGLVAYQRFNDTRDETRTAGEHSRHLAEAARRYEQALEMIPETAVIDRGATHNQLGNIYRVRGDTERALYHYSQGIRHSELADDAFGAGQTRFNVALTLLGADRLSDARIYAEAALNNFQNFGDRAASEIDKAKRLVSVIDQHRTAGSVNAG
jgi:tetratricopeptide (TPR) repeat protein